MFILNNCFCFYRREIKKLVRKVQIVCRKIGESSQMPWAVPFSVLKIMDFDIGISVSLFNAFWLLMNFVAYVNQYDFVYNLYYKFLLSFKKENGTFSLFQGYSVRTAQPSNNSLQGKLKNLDKSLRLATIGQMYVTVNTYALKERLVFDRTDITLLCQVITFFLEYLLQDKTITDCTCFACSNIEWSSFL